MDWEQVNYMDTLENPKYYKRRQVFSETRFSLNFYLLAVFNIPHLRAEQIYSAVVLLYSIWNHKFFENHKDK